MHSMWLYLEFVAFCKCYGESMHCLSFKLDNSYIDNITFLQKLSFFVFNLKARVREWTHCILYSMILNNISPFLHIICQHI